MFTIVDFNSNISVDNFKRRLYTILINGNIVEAELATLSLSRLMSEYTKIYEFRSFVWLMNTVGCRYVGFLDAK